MHIQWQHGKQEVKNARRRGRAGPPAAAASNSWMGGAECGLPSMAPAAPAVVSPSGQ